MNENPWDEFIKTIVVTVIAAFIMFLIGMAGLAVAGCGAIKPIPPAPPAPSDAGTVDDCAAACANLARMECPGWQGSPGTDEMFGTEDDVSCEVVCRTIVGGDPTATLHQRCTADSKSCDDVERCFDADF